MARGAKILTLKTGRELELLPLNMMDIEDGETTLGMGPMPLWFPEDGKGKMSAAGKLIWLLARKAGLSPADIMARKWKVQLEEVMVEVTAQDLLDNREVIFGFLGVESESGADTSGLDSGKDSDTKS